MEMAAATRSCEGRQEKGDQHRDDGDDDQKFDKREALARTKRDVIA